MIGATTAGRSPGSWVALGGDVDGRLHRAALLVTEDDDQHAAELGDGVLEAPGHDRVLGGVAGDTGDEEVAEPLVVDDLGRYPRVGTAQHGGERRLVLGERAAAPVVAPRVAEVALHESAVADGEAGDRLVGCEGRRRRFGRMGDVAEHGGTERRGRGGRAERPPHRSQCVAPRDLIHRSPS